MSRHKVSNKRKNYFIKKDFQVRFIFKFCLLLFIGVVLSTGLLFLFSQDSLTSSFQHSRLEIKNTNIAILPVVLYTNLITLGLITLATVVITLFVSHKIAGPLFRFEKELAEIAKGDLRNKLVLREMDQLANMAEAINTMVLSLNKKIDKVQKRLESVRQSAREDDASKALIKELDKLHNMISIEFKT